MRYWTRMSVAAVVPAVMILLGGALAEANPFQTGGDRLVALQNTDGGWDIPLDDGNPASGSSPSTSGPVGTGLARAYVNTGLAGQYTALQGASGYLLAKANNFTIYDGHLAAILDEVFGGATHTSYVKSGFYDQLDAGTYNGGYTTATYVAAIRTIAYGNDAAWSLGLGIVSAAKCGAPTTAWIQGTEDEVNELDSSDFYHVLGLGGAVFGLSYAGVVFDPTSGSAASASSVADLATMLASYQMTSGGFTYFEGEMAPGDESTQETAYAILALNQINRAGYTSEILAAGAWLVSSQLPSGGWEYYIGVGEDNQATGEALWGLGAPIAEPASLTLLGLAALACRRRRRY